jgi:hypothetical protein
VAFGALLLSLVMVACSGGESGPATLPTTGAAVCEGLKEAERFRYVFSYVIESPKQAEPPDDSALGDYALPPSFPDFRFETKHAGAFVNPDRLDIEITSPSAQGQSSLRTVRIGENQWFLVDDNWQVDTNPNPAAFQFSPPVICDAMLSPLDLAGATGVPENVGDTAAMRFSINGATLPVSSQLLGPQSDMGRLLQSYDVNLWLSEDKARLVKAEAVSKATYPFGRELSIRFTLEAASYDEKGIEVEPPI